MAQPSTTIIDVVIQEMRGVLESDENLHILNVDAREFRRMEDMLRHIRKKFQDQQNRVSEPVEKCLEKLKDSIEEAKSLITRAKRQQGCCCFTSKPNLSTEKTAWKKEFGDLYQELQSLSGPAKTRIEEPAQHPELKSHHTDGQIEESARHPELKSDHARPVTESARSAELKSDRTDRQMAESARPPEPKSDHSRQIAESARPPELKSDHTDRQIAESARPPELKSDQIRQIVESAWPPDLQYGASTWPPELKNDAFVDSQQIVESMDKDP